MGKMRNSESMYGKFKVHRMCV